MRPHLFTAISAASLVVFVATTSLMLLPAHGATILKWDRPDGYGVEAISYGESLYLFRGHGTRAERLLTIVPLGVWAAGSAVLPVVFLASVAGQRWRRRYRWVQAGLCGQCGYDLRATPAKGGALLDRCPECGAAGAGAPAGAAAR